MNKIYLGTQPIVNLDDFYNKSHIDASISALDAAIETIDASVDAHEGSIDSLTDTVSDLDASLQALITNVATNYYTKTHIDASVADLEQQIQAMSGIDLVVVDVLPAASADTLRKIYLVPSANPKTQNAKDEYITIDKGAEADPRYVWEQIGSTEIDLSGYATEDYVDTAVADVSALALEVSTKLDSSVSEIWTALEAYATKAAVDASINVLDASVSALESEVKIFGNTTITNLVSCTSTAYDAIASKDPSTLYVVID